MIIKKAFVIDIIKAEKELNKIYDNNITTGTIIDKSNLNNYPYFQLNLYAKDNKKKGARIGFINKIDKLACFHVYYDFFDILLNINLKAVIITYNDWIIKKDINGKIIGNPKVLDKNCIHRVKLASYICRCNKG